jgi:hypothetical protein
VESKTWVTGLVGWSGVDPICYYLNILKKYYLDLKKKSNHIFYQLFKFLLNPLSWLCHVKITSWEFDLKPELNEKLN